MENLGQNGFGMFVKMQSCEGWKNKNTNQSNEWFVFQKNVQTKLLLPSTNNTAHQHQAYCPIAHVDKDILPAFSFEKSVGTNNW